MTLITSSSSTKNVVSIISSFPNTTNAGHDDDTDVERDHDHDHDHDHEPDDMTMTMTMMTTMSMTTTTSRSQLSEMRAFVHIDEIFLTRLTK